MPGYGYGHRIGPYGHRFLHRHGFGYRYGYGRRHSFGHGYGYLRRGFVPGVGLGLLISGLFY
ncbi:hypothetical protein [Haloplasma contractile]|uniref:Uncharacterized protein n=1 Tax=Haloplasma contractile SSD-17B TaxID=1033810 RepID=U2E9Z4_9MOLU|nr:hypothetical protein [Haloplasma contractile]ERJ11666.1 hypothetical protein HLPCO_002367 [Haloplasma contractile SSD-17B]